jgi:hypothetical protein
MMLYKNISRSSMLYVPEPARHPDTTEASHCGKSMHSQGSSFPSQRLVHTTSVMLVHDPLTDLKIITYVLKDRIASNPAGRC